MVKSTILVNEVKEGVFAARETPDTIDTTLYNMVEVGKYRKMLLLVHLSASTNNDTIIIPAGVNPPAFRSGIGDYTYTSTGGAKELVLKLETARYMQADGYIYVTFPTHVSLAGTIEAYGLR